MSGQLFQNILYSEGHTPQATQAQAKLMFSTVDVPEKITHMDTWNTKSGSHRLEYGFEGPIYNTVEKVQLPFESVGFVHPGL